MRNIRCLVLAGTLSLLSPAAIIAQPGTGAAAQHQVSSSNVRLASLFKSGEFKDDKGERLAYRYFEPSAHNVEGARYPVILYLHGEGEAGTDNKSQLTTTECATVWIQPAHLAENPAYVLAPQIPKGKDWIQEPVYSNTLDLLNQFLKRHPAADLNRIYIVGFSMGANGLYKMLLKNPGLFAAAMPISGSADQYLGDEQAWAALKNTPVIIVHAYDDTVVPVSGAINAAAALQNAGNTFLGYGAPTPSLWSPASTPSAHDAWFTAFNKFEVIYNSLFLGNLERTHHGEISPTTLYTKKSLGDGITQVWDYALGTSLIVERADKAVIIDTTMGHGGLYQYIHDNVLLNKDVPLEVFLTHQHEDHTLGLVSFVGASQLKRVYVHPADSAPVIKLLGPDAGKVHLVKDGDLIPLGGTNIEVIGVPGHTLGSIVMKYEHFLFTGDSIGTGYIGVGAFSVEQYISSIQHLLDRMGGGKYTIYGGHTGEVTAPMTETYVYNLMACAKAIVRDAVPVRIYWRGRESSTRMVSTVGATSITYSLANVHRIEGALAGLRINQGTLIPGYSPEFAPITVDQRFAFAPSTSYYTALVGASVDSLEITPTVLDSDYKSLTLNGESTDSGKPHHVNLGTGPNRFAVTVTAADGTTRTYTLDVRKGKS